MNDNKMLLEEDEKSLLASLLFQPYLLDKCVGTIEKKHFYYPLHQDIYETILSLNESKRDISATIVADELEHRGLINGEIHRQIEDMEFHEGISGSIKNYIDRILRFYPYRRLTEIGEEMIKSANKWEEDAIEKAETAIYELIRGSDTSFPVSMNEAVWEYMPKLEERRTNYVEGIANGLPTGYSSLDRLIGGLQPGRLHVLAARPSLGKTALALNMALDIASKERNALFFSLEMERDEIVQRALSIKSDINQSLFQSGDLGEEEMEQMVYPSVEELGKYFFWIDDSTYTLSNLRAKAHRLNARTHLSVIVLDYLQLLESNRRLNESRAEEVARLSRGLKKLARELKVPLLAVAQLNREIEKRTNGKPVLSDLGESGGIEKDADVVMFLHVEEDQVIFREQSLPYKVSVIVKKNRNGAIGTANLRFYPRTTRFEEEL